MYNSNTKIQNETWFKICTVLGQKEFTFCDGKTNNPLFKNIKTPKIEPDLT
jgi:hypothetical protein